MMRVFVYGTLMRNCYNHTYLRGRRYLGRAVLSGFSLYNLGGYPGIVPDPDEKVIGEVYEIDAQTLNQLDILEDNGRLYTRESAEVHLDGRNINAEVYVWNGKVLKKDKIELCFQPWTDDKIFKRS